MGAYHDRTIRLRSEGLHCHVIAYHQTSSGRNLFGNHRNDVASSNRPWNARVTAILGVRVR